MMRWSLLATAVSTGLAGANVQAGIDQDFVLGFMEGILDGQGTDFAVCLVDGVLPPVQGGAQALKELKAGVLSRNFSEVGSGIQLLAQAIHDSRHELMPKCSEAMEDGSHMKKVIKRYHDISSFLGHIKGDLVNDDNDLIGKDFEAMLQAVMKGDHSGVGQHLGMLLHRIFIEPEFPHRAHLNSLKMNGELGRAIPSWMQEDFAIGLLEGLADDQGTDFAMCAVNGILPVVQGGAMGVKTMKEGLMSRNLTLAVEGMQETAAAVQGAHGVAAKCKDVKGDFADAMAVIKSLSGPLDLLKHIGGNVVSERVALKEEAGEAMQARKDKHYGSFGQHLGSFLHMVFIGPFPNSADGNSTVVV